ncbi:hypothetical protein PHJA_002674800 [Phtheirospermum japonicum]|uniref:Uncharacterized protein n=1 Tax=Phtheirospermum japonicum TaxID=374723 RepID=A0A830D0Y2_9LAMI|nr:hypothetical protein PHJA_002674800 [Phtheirospermum japonicum]
MVKMSCWSDLNPRRRYSTCDNFRKIGGCNYRVCNDGSLCPRAQQIVLGLHKRVNMLENELKCRRSREK